MLPEVIAGRYRVLEELGRGGMGAVYRARDASRPDEIALKVLLAGRFSESGLRHFEQEFRTLTALSHPNLIEVYDFGRVAVDDDGRQVPFFTMELVDGVTLDRHLRPGGDDFAALYDCLAQVGQALAYLHGRGVVHQDVKPSNILVVGAGQGRRVKLMDLGLAGHVRDGTGPGRIRGTAAYLAPEVARGAGGADPRSDLYSLGCVAYQMVAGRTPFHGASAAEVLRAHLLEAPVPPSTIHRSVPRALEELILALLAKDPGLRPATADRFLRLLDEAAGGGLHIETAATRRHRVLGAGFVGREAEIDRLAGLLDDVRGGAGKLALLVGEAGVGKSRLLREFQVRVQLDGLDLHAGRPEAARLTSCLFADALRRALRSRGPLRPETAARCGPALETLLGPLEGLGAGPSTVSLEERYRLLGAVSSVLEEISREQPVILALEDLQHADETTCAILGHLARGFAARPGSGVARLLLLGTCRADEISRSSPLFDLLAEGRDQGVLEEIFLKPFGPEETAQMLRAMLGCPTIPALFLQRILEETHGNPLYLQELVALLAEEGHVEPGSSTSPDSGVLSRVELPGKVLDLLRRRFDRLDEEARLLLQAAGVLGSPAVDPDAVAAITDLRWERIVRLLLDLHSSGLVQRDEPEGGAPAYHIMPALAGLALEATPPEEARRLHSRAVSYLERRGVPRRHGAWAAFALHAEAAGQPGRAMEANRRAGELAQELHAHREAADLYGRAIELALRHDAGPASVLCELYSRRGASWARLGELQRAEEDYRWMLARAEKAADDALRARAHLALGRVLADSSRYEQARDEFDLAHEIALRLRDDPLAAQARLGLGRAAFKRGAYEDGVGHLDQALARARRAGRTDLEVEAFAAKGMLFREQGNLRLSLENFRQAAERSGGNASASLEEAIEEGYALALEVQGKHREATAAYARARERARERGDARAVASLTTSLGAAHVKLGEYDKARHELEDALAAQRRLGSREGLALTHQSLALLHAYRGRYEDALEAAQESLRLAQRIGKPDLVATSLNLIGGIHLRVGDLPGAATRLEEAQRIMRDLRSPRSLAVFLLDLGDLRTAEGHAEPARRHFQESAFLARKVGDRRLESVAMSRLGEVHLLDNNHDRARVACRKALELIEGSGLPREEADALLLRARIELSRPGGDLVRAEMDALLALERYRDLSEPEQIWQAEHVVARTAARLGRHEEAAGRLDRAHRYLEAVRARLGEPFRESFVADLRRRELYDDWERFRDRLGDRPPDDQPPGGDYARLQEEVAALKRLLEVNRGLHGASAPEELPGAILDAAIDLTAAERGVVLLADGAELARGPEGAPFEAPDLSMARTLARRVMEDAQPLLSPDTETDERLAGLDALRELRIRSILAVPLRIQDQVAGALYLDHRSDRRRFTPAHLEIAARLCEQAALAFDNARRLQSSREREARLEQLHRDLERTVQSQRTELASAREELSFTRSSFELRYRFEDLVGASNAMQKVYHVIERLAPKKLPVLISGESGTGKELIARALHSKSDRSDGPFFSVNCAALAESLLESELFGYRKGAFTGADRDKPGYFELAHGGTLFLDEIGDTGSPMQAKLLRAIERGEVLPVGGKSAVRVDVRIVSATHRDLEALIREGRFREDLYYRINVAWIAVPPLRERAEDIPLLVEHFLTLLAEDEGQPKRDIEPAALERLASCEWPGNVRELQHRILRIATFSKGATLTLRDVLRYGDLPAPAGAAGAPAATTPSSGKVESLEEIERKQIIRALDQAGGNKTRAAELLGINRATLFRKIKRFGL